MSSISPRSKHDAVRNFPTNGGPTSDKMYVDIPLGAIKRSRQRVAICAAVVLLAGTADVCFDYSSVEIKTCCVATCFVGKWP